jgi:hypothetical protein
MDMADKTSASKRDTDHSARKSIRARRRDAIEARKRQEEYL